MTTNNAKQMTAKQTTREAQMTTNNAKQMTRSKPREANKIELP